MRLDLQLKVVTAACNQETALHHGDGGRNPKRIIW